MIFSSSERVMVLVRGISVAYVKRYRSPPAMTLNSSGIGVNFRTSRAGMHEIAEMRKTLISAFVSNSILNLVLATYNL